MRRTRARTPRIAVNGHGNTLQPSSRLLLLLAHNRQALNRHIISHRIQRRPFPLARLRLKKIPPHHLVSRVIQQNHRSGHALNLPLNCRQMPVIKVLGRCDAPLQHNIRIRHAPRQLPHRNRVRTIALLNHLNPRPQPAAFPKRRLLKPLNLHAKPKVFIRVNPRRSCHEPSSKPSVWPAAAQHSLFFPVNRRPPSNVLPMTGIFRFGCNICLAFAFRKTGPYASIPSPCAPVAIPYFCFR